MKNAPSRIITGAVILLLLTACLPLRETTLPISLPAATSTINPRSVESGLEVIFTNPSDPRAHSYEGGPDILLGDAIDAAQLSVDMAAYSLNLWSIRDALIHAYKRGVDVRLVMESTNMDNQVIHELRDAGIEVLGDSHQGLMHNKFIIIDRSDVWTGSMNYTTSGVYKDNNNLLHIRSRQAAQDYTREFEEMFTKNRFGPEKTTGTPYPKVNLAGSPVEIYFSPQDQAGGRIVELLQGAQESVYFLAYSFTSNPIGSAIMERAQAGLRVAGVMDDTQIKSNRGTEYDPFKQAGLDVVLDGNKDGLMHHKVIVIDQKIVITGSYNFSSSAENINDENIVIIFSPVVAAKYIEEFQRVYTQAKGQ